MVHHRNIQIVGLEIAKAVLKNGDKNVGEKNTSVLSTIIKKEDRY